MPFRSVRSIFVKLIRPVFSTRMSIVTSDLAALDRQRVLAETPVERAGELMIHKYLPVIAQLADRQLASNRPRRICRDRECSRRIDREFPSASERPT